MELKNKHPKFWAKVRNVSGVIAVIAGTVITLPVSAPVLTAATIIGAIATAIAGKSQYNKIKKQKELEND